MDALSQIEARWADFAGHTPASFKTLQPHQRNRHFEEFVAYHVLKCKHARDIEKHSIASVMTGSTHDNQVDALCVLVGGAIARDADHAVALIEEMDEPSISYVFMQSTSGRSFDQHKMVMFSTGTCSFFKEVPSFQENEDLKRRRAIKERIAAHLGERAAQCIRSFVYYVALGRWREEREKEEARSFKGWRRFAAEEIQRASGEPHLPAVEIIDVERLLSIVTQNDLADAMPVELPPIPSAYARKVKAPHLLALPPIDAAASGYIGCIEANQLIELLEREDGQGLLDTLAYSNVRAFLGANAEVNTEIAATLASRARSKFVLLNNGVTLIASAAALSDGDLRLENYQIVNGLQTSTILYQQRNHLEAGNAVHVPIKIVVTDDEDLKLAIVRSTNRQTAIPDLQHASQDPFVRALWHAFNERRTKAADPIWFEHRANEYDHDDAVDDDRVVTVPDLLAAMVSTFIRQPHIAGAGEAEMRKKIPVQVFNPQHRKQPYLTAARMSLAVREWLQTNDRSKTLVRFDAQLLYGLFILLEPDGVRHGLSTQAVDQRCAVMEQRLDQSATVANAIAATAEAIRAIAGPVNKKKPAWRTLPRDKGRMTSPLEKRLEKPRKELVWM